MPQTRRTLTELPRPPWKPPEPATREPRVPQVPAPDEEGWPALQERLDEIAASLQEIQELLEKVLRELSGPE